MDEQKKFIYVNVNGKKVRYRLNEDGSYDECDFIGGDDCDDCDCDDISSGDNGKKWHFNWNFKKEKSSWEFFPTASFCILLYLCLGFIWGLWHPGWIVFLMVPIVIGVLKKGLRGFPYPVFIAAVYLCLGCIWGFWHPGWLVFLTIPIYYTILSSKSFPAFLHAMYPLFTVIVYLILGFFWQLWHPGWLVFLTIPVFNGFAEMVRHAKRK